MYKSIDQDVYHKMRNTVDLQLEPKYHSAGRTAPSTDTACKAGTLQFLSARFVLRHVELIEDEQI